MGELCRCGHGLDAHTGTSVAGLPCKTCGFTKQGLLTGQCAGWNPEVPAGPPDLQQAIQAATSALRAQDPPIGLAEPWAKVARIAVEAAWDIERAAELDWLATFEVAIRDSWDRDGSNHMLRYEVGRALAALDLARERPNG